MNNKPGSFFKYLFIVLLFSLLWSCSEEESEVDKQVQSQIIDSGKLAGKWLRPDGGYVLELSNIGDDGSLQAAYFNPKPIRVAVAGWRWGGSNLEVYVEFDDVNYKGSNYSLKYFDNGDRLVGNYYQAMMGQNFEVEFERKAE
jgi:hypothetical protein